MASSLNSRTRVASIAGATRADPQYFVVFELSLVLLNIFTFIYHLSSLSIFNVASNAVSIGLIAYSVRAIFRAQSDDSAGKMYLLSAVVMTLVERCLQFEGLSTTDALKYLSTAAGRTEGDCARPSVAQEAPTKRFLST